MTEIKTEESYEIEDERDEDRPNFGLVFKATDEDAERVFELIESMPNSYLVYATRARTRLWIQRSGGERG